MATLMQTVLHLTLEIMEALQQVYGLAGSYMEYITSEILSPYAN